MDRRGQQRRSNARQNYTQQPSPSSASSTGADVQQVYGFALSGQYGAAPGVTPNPAAYGTGNQFAEAQQQQSQQYEQYGTNIMYAMDQAQPSQFAASNTGQYYMPGQSSLVPELASQPISGHYPTPTSYPDTNTPTLPTYSMDPNQPPIYSVYAQPAQYAAQQQTQSTEQPFEAYQAQVRQIFTLTRDGSLHEVGARLLEVSQYLLGNVEPLGLTRDDEALHDGRIRLWDEFNRAWLVTLQRQIDLSQQMRQSNEPLANGQSIMNAQTLERLSSELVRLCDNIEKHGLVDYQMGVAEEEIMELLLRCLSVLNSNGDRQFRGSSSAAAGVSRRRGG